MFAILQAHVADAVNVSLASLHLLRTAAGSLESQLQRALQEQV